MSTRDAISSFLYTNCLLCFYAKTGFWSSYCQISTDLDKILHTPFVIWNTLVGRLRPRSAHGWLQAKPKRLCFSVILVTHSVPWTEPDPKSSIFHILRVPYDYPAHSLQETVLPQSNGIAGKPRL